MSEPPDDPLQEALAAAHAEGCRVYPGIDLPLASFGEHAGRVAAGVFELERHGADLYLACACAERNRQALLMFERRLLPAVDSQLHRLGVGNAQLDDIRQVLRMRLLSEAQPRIASYAAKGPLLGWVRVVATRLALNMVDGARSESARLVEDGAALDRMVAAAADPELGAIRNRFQADFQRALDESLAALTPRAKTVLRMHYLDGMNLEAIALTYRVHRATVARWLVGIRTTVMANLRERLRAGLEPTSSDFRSLAVALKDELTISLDRLLGDKPTG